MVKPPGPIAIWLARLIVWMPVPGMLKVTTSAPAAAFASWTAARNVQTPPAVAQVPLITASGASLVDVTTKEAAATGVTGPKSETSSETVTAPLMSA
jgi:hypothetical protein